MAVAVKNAPVKTSWRPFHRLPTASLAAALYLIVCLGVVFKLVPTLWWANTTALTNEFVSTAVLIVVMAVVAFGLGFVGTRIFAGQAIPGLRAGIFMALVLLLFAALLARWVGGMIENWVYGGLFGATGPFIGAVVAGIFAAVLLYLVVRIFHRPGFERWLVRLEGQGWFAATSFKRGQGMRVRRGTICAVLVVGLCGIWVLQSHRTLDRGSPDWGINIPFTGKVEVEDPGDAKVILNEEDIRANSQMRIKEAGASKFKPGQLVSRKEFDDEVERIVKEAYAAAQSKLPEMDLGDKFSVEAALQELRKNKVSAALPTGNIVVDRFVLREINQRLHDDFVKITKAELPASQSPQPGDVLSRNAFNEVVSRLKSEGVDKENLPEAKPAAPLDIAPTYASATILPAAKFTVPLLLFALTLWFGWRVVNMPVFADFLIATEAELNKVSWTTRKRLVQDTIVVLMTLVLMAVFLFVVDVAWGRILSWRPIGGLQVSDQKQEPGNEADLKW